MWFDGKFWTRPIYQDCVWTPCSDGVTRAGPLCGNFRANLVASHTDNMSCKTREYTILGLNALWSWNWIVKLKWHYIFHNFNSNCHLAEEKSVILWFLNMIKVRIFWLFLHWVSVSAISWLQQNLIWMKEMGRGS